MRKKLSIPAFVFKPVFTDQITTETIKRQDNILEINFPVFEKDEVLKNAEILAMRKRKAHDRDIDDLLETLDLVYHKWMEPNYELRKEALEIIPMITGQSRKLCELELNGSMAIYQKKVAELFLYNEIGGKQYLEEWIPKGSIKVHAQPRGVLYHNLAGNTFNVGLISLFYGMISKNVNLIKLPHEEPYFAIRLAQSIAEIDKKLSKEMAIMYWAGRRGDIFDDLFNSGNIDCIIAWGGLRSIEDIRRRSYRYGIKMIDHGPKLSFSIISEKILKEPERLEEITSRLATDVVFWNQKACLSPRVVYIMEEPRKTAINIKENGSNKNSLENIFEDNKNSISSADSIVEKMLGKKSTNGRKNELDLSSLMKRSANLLQKQVSDVSPLGFAKKVAEKMGEADSMLPRAHLTEGDGMDMVKKREYFSLKYELNDQGILITPPDNKLDWTVAYVRNPPSLNEIQICFNRFLIITRISNLYDLVHLIQKADLKKYLQTISVYGSDSFIENVAEEFSLLGACRFPRVGEHNIQSLGAPWDGHYILQNLLRWSFIGFNKLDPTEEDGLVLNLKGT